MRTRPKLLETALRQYIARETGVDLIRVGEIEVSMFAFVPVLCFPFGLFNFCLPSSIFSPTWRGHVGIKSGPCG